MVLLIAWRNIWRNRTRTMVVIGAISIGVWAAMFMSGFATGMINSYITNAIENIISHIQVHQPEFSRDMDVKYIIEKAAELEERLNNNDDLKAVSVRSLSSGMISSSKSSRGIRIKAIEPEAEIAVSSLNEKVVEGEYFNGKRKNQVLLSQVLAGKLNVKLRSKIVLTFQNLDGDITAAAFRIVGIFDSGNTPFDESHVFILRKDLNRLLSPSDGEDVESGPGKNPPAIAHEVAIMLKDQGRLDSVAQDLSRQFPGLKVETYRDISPELQLYESQIKFVSLIYLTVIMLALVFGIVNTMLMAVLERIRELGMLMAIGMNKLRVFSMIVLETIMLGIVGAPLGLLLGFLSVNYLGKHGINLSTFSRSLKMYGMSDVIYFDLDPIVYWQVPTAVALTAIVASLYPAFKAIRLRPVEAIRKI